MNPRITLVVVVLFALLVGYVYMFELNKTPEQLGTPTPEVQPQVLQLNEDEVQAVEVRDLRFSREVRITRTQGGWQVEKPTLKAADGIQVDSTVSQLTKLQATRVLTDVKDLQTFGLRNATLEARLIMSDTRPFAITFGDKTPDGYNYYAVYTGDTSKVFIVSSYVVDDLVGWLDTPPYEPTPTPTFTPSPVPTPTVEATPGVTSTWPAATPTP